MPPGRRRSPFLLLEGATLLSGAGNGVAIVALPWLILERTGSASYAALVAAATALPLLVSSLFSGTIVDIAGRRRTAMGADVLSALAVAAIPLADAAGLLSVPVLAALAVVGALFDPAGVTARETMLPAAAEAARWPLERVNGVHEAVWGAAFLIGPGVGGVLIATVGAVGALWATAAGFGLSVVLLALMRLPLAGRPPRHARPQVWAGTLEGIRFVWHDPLLRAIGLVAALLVGVYLPIEGVILPVHFQAEDTPEALGLVVMAMSAGGIAGALLYGWLAPRLPVRATFLGALMGTAVAILAMAPLPPVGVMIVLGLVVGLLYGPVNPITNLAMQRRTPEALRGRVVGLLTSVGYAAGPLGYLAAGPLVDALGVRAAFALLAAGLVVVAVAAVWLPGLRGLDRLGEAEAGLPSTLVAPSPRPGGPPAST
ncbi:MAG: MFS transporter [Thermoleophilia bacterium]|nr:MFS transporter [Thermoleophilia bacterium]